MDDITRSSGPEDALDRVAEAFPGAARIDPAAKKRPKRRPKFRVGTQPWFEQEIEVLLEQVHDPDPIVARFARRVLLAADAIAKARRGHQDRCLCGWCPVPTLPLDLEYAYLMVWKLDGDWYQ